MANPPKYTQGFDFSDFQETNPSTPLPGVRVDIELAALEEVSISVRDAIMDVRRSDGALKNEIVTEDSLAPGLVDILTAQTDVAGAAASAAAAAASAVEADGFAEDAESAANEIASTLATLAASGGVSDWGFFTDAPSVTLDWGTFP